MDRMNVIIWRCGRNRITLSGRGALASCIAFVDSSTCEKSGLRFDVWQVETSESSNDSQKTLSKCWKKKKISRFGRCRCGDLFHIRVIHYSAIQTLSSSMPSTTNEMVEMKRCASLARLGQKNHLFVLAAFVRHAHTNEWRCHFGFVSTIIIISIETLSLVCGYRPLDREPQCRPKSSQAFVCSHCAGAVERVSKFGHFSRTNLSFVSRYKGKSGHW